MVVLSLISIVAARPSPQLQNEPYYVPLVGYPDQPMILPNGAPLQAQQRYGIVTNSPLQGQQADQFTVPGYDQSQRSRLVLSGPSYAIMQVQPRTFTVPSYDC